MHIKYGYKVYELKPLVQWEMIQNISINLSGIETSLGNY